MFVCHPLRAAGWESERCRGERFPGTGGLLTVTAHCSRHPKRAEGMSGTVCPQGFQSLGGEGAGNKHCPPEIRSRHTCTTHDLAGEGGEQRRRGVAEDKRASVRRTIPGGGNSTHTGRELRAGPGASGRGAASPEPLLRLLPRQPLPGGSSLLAPGLPAAPAQGLLLESLPDYSSCSRATLF